MSGSATVNVWCRYHCAIDDNNLAPWMSVVALFTYWLTDWSCISKSLLVFCITAKCFNLFSLEITVFFLNGIFHPELMLSGAAQIHKIQAAGTRQENDTQDLSSQRRPKSLCTLWSQGLLSEFCKGLSHFVQLSWSVWLCAAACPAVGYLREITLALHQPEAFRLPVCPLLLSSRRRSPPQRCTFLQKAT